MNVTKNIVFVTSAQPSANPRMMKEAVTLIKLGYKVIVVWCPIAKWADPFDEKIVNQHPDIKWVQAGYHHQLQPIGYWYARLRQKFWKIVYWLIGNRSDAAIKSLVLYSQELSKAALKQKADLFIGHNLGSLPAIVKASKKYNAKAIFDFEDFHRGEFNQFSVQSIMTSEVENKYIPNATSLTTASPAITDAYNSIFIDKPISTINNVFPLSYAVDKLVELPQKPLKLFWFSQYVGRKRGLENILQAMSAFNEDEISITLLGTCSTEMKSYFGDLASSLHLSQGQLLFMDPVEEKEIVAISSKHHIGVASELGHIQNRELCLTNKIFMYLLAGNALIVTDTKSQKDFLNENKNIGLLYDQTSIDSLVKSLKIYIENPDLLHQHRANALTLANAKMNWEIEQQIFLDNVNRTLNS